MRVQTVIVFHIVGFILAVAVLAWSVPYVGNTLLDTTSVISNVATFNNVDYMINQDEERELRVVVDFERGTQALTSIGSPAEFTVVSATTTAEDRDFAQKVEPLSVDETHTILVEGLVMNKVSEPTISTSGENNEIVNFTFRAEVTAFGRNQFISATSTDAFPGIFVDKVDGANITARSINTNATLQTTENVYRVNRNQTRTLDITVQVTKTSGSGLARVTVPELVYGNDANDPTGENVTLGAPDFRTVQ